MRLSFRHRHILSTALSLAIVCAPHHTAQAATIEAVGSGNPVFYVPSYFASGEYEGGTVGTGVTLTINEGAYITNTGYFSNGGGVSYYGTFTNNDTVSSSWRFSGDGLLVNNASFYSRILNSSAAATIENNGTIWGNSVATWSLSGIFNNNPGATFNVHSTTNNNSTGVFTNYGAMNIRNNSFNNAGTFINASTGVLDVGYSTTLGSLTGNVQNDGRIIFSRTNADSYAGDITGSGDVEMTGGSTLTLSGNSSYTGTTNAQSVTLEQQGSLTTGDFLVGAAAVVNNSGFVTVTSGALDINGAFNNLASGTLSIGNGGAAGGLEGNLQNAGALIFNSTGNLLYADTVSGAGDVYKRGSGTLILSGTNDYTGTTDVEAGTLLVNGALTDSVVTISGGGTLGGSGALNTVVVNDGGSLAPGNSIGVLTVSGNLTFSSDAVYRVEISGTQSDRTDVSGIAALNGAQLSVTALDPLSSYQSGRQYTILTATGGVNGTFSGATTLTPFLNIATSYDANNAYLTISVDDAGFESVATTGNQNKVAAALNTLPQSGDTLALYNALLGLSAEDASAAFDQLSGEGHASIQTGFLQDTGAVRGVMNVRLHTPGGNASSSKQGVQLASLGDDWASFVPVEQGALSYWSNLFGSWGNNRANGNAGKVENRTGGLLFGADYNHPTDDWMSGVMFGYSRTNFDVDSRASSGDSDNYHLGVYGAKAWDALTVRGGVSYTRHETDTRRDVVVGGFTDTLRADYGTDSAQAFAELGYTLDAKYAVVEPYFNLTHVNLDTPGYSEEGGGSLLNVAKTSSDTSYTTLGIRASRPFEDKAAKGLVSAGLGWQHAIGDKNSTTSMSFNGSSSFAVSGTPIATDVAVVEFGAALELTDSANLGVSYQGQFGEDYTQNSVVGKLGFTF